MAEYLVNKDLVNALKKGNTREKEASSQWDRLGVVRTDGEDQAPIFILQFNRTCQSSRGKGENRDCEDEETNLNLSISSPANVDLFDLSYDELSDLSYVINRMDVSSTMEKLYAELVDNRLMGRYQREYPFYELFRNHDERNYATSFYTYSAANPLTSCFDGEECTWH